MPFSSHTADFQFQDSSPLDNLTPNPANKKNDQSLLYFLTATGAAAHTTVVAAQVISHTRTAFGNTSASLQGSEGGIISSFRSA